jgi:hypothetical protein
MGTGALINYTTMQKHKCNAYLVVLFILTSSLSSSDAVVATDLPLPPAERDQGRGGGRELVLYEKKKKKDKTRGIKHMKHTWPHS